MSAKQVVQLVLSFAVVGAVVGSLWQFGPDGGDAPWSVIAGISVGAVATYMGWRSMRDRATDRPTKPPPIPVFSGIVALAGAVILLMGVAAGSSNLVLAGLSLLGVGALVIAIAVWQRRL